MSGKFTARATTDIANPASEVRKRLTRPELIKKYFLQAVSGRREGSPHIFKGKKHGGEYPDKGTMLKKNPERAARNKTEETL